MMAIDKNNPEWRHTDEMREIIWEVYDLTHLNNASSFSTIVTNSGVLPLEYNAMTVEEWREQAEKKTQNKIVVRCPYCGSSNVRQTTFWSDFGLWQSVGKSWVCKGCGSYF